MSAAGPGETLSLTLIAKTINSTTSETIVWFSPPGTTPTLVGH